MTLLQPRWQTLHEMECMYAVLSTLKLSSQAGQFRETLASPHWISRQLYRKSSVYIPFPRLGCDGCTLSKYLCEGPWRAALQKFNILSDSIRFSVSQSFCALHRNLKVGMQCLQSRERYITAASALAAAAPLMLRHSDCSGEWFVSLDALSVPACVCLRGDEQVCSYSAEPVELA